CGIAVFQGASFLTQLGGNNENLVFGSAHGTGVHHRLRPTFNTSEICPNRLHESRTRQRTTVRKDGTGSLEDHPSGADQEQKYPILGAVFRSISKREWPGVRLCYCHYVQRLRGNGESL